jgi:hypothetical protein
METSTDITHLTTQFQQLLKKIDELIELVDNLDIEIPEWKEAENQYILQNEINYWKLYNFTKRYKEITIELFLKELGIKMLRINK